MPTKIPNLRNQPELQDLTTVSFDFTIQNAPITSLRCQTVNLPNLTLAEAEMATPFATVWHHGGHIEYGELELVAVVDERLTSYREILNWMRALAPDQNFQQRTGATTYTLEDGDESLYGTAKLDILTDKHNTGVSATFHKIFPVSVSDLTFDITDMSFITMDVSFKFTYFEFTQTRQ